MSLVSLVVWCVFLEACSSIIDPRLFTCRKWQDRRNTFPESDAAGKLCGCSDQLVSEFFYRNGRWIMEGPEGWKAEDPITQEGSVAPTFAKVFLSQMIERAVPENTPPFFIDVLPGSIADTRVILVETSPWVKDLDLESKIAALPKGWLNEFITGAMREEQVLAEGDVCDFGNWNVMMVYREERRGGSGAQLQDEYANERLLADLRRLDSPEVDERQ